MRIGKARHLHDPASFGIYLVSAGFHIEIYREVVDRLWRWDYAKGNLDILNLRAGSPRRFGDGVLLVCSCSGARQRIIQVVLAPVNEAKDHYIIDNNIDTPNGEKFIAEVVGYQTVSKLMRVNREARHESLLFYRVHLLCRFIKPWEIKAQPAASPRGILHFNPDYDFLHIFHTRDNGENPSLLETLSDFFYHLKTTYDQVNNALKDKLEQLHEVFFVFRTAIVIENNHPEDSQFEILQNTPLPIWSASPGFERVTRDPRPGLDIPLLDSNSQTQTRYSCGLTYAIESALTWASFVREAVAVPEHYVFNMETAQTYLRLQQKRAGQTTPSWMSTFGFWLFHLPEGIEHISRFRNSHVNGQGVHQLRQPMPDLSKVWPELLIASLY
ncbi:hypothetical protein B0T21DRAFT_388211 [Apiosordaria backusii]|uniref:Uncharacterized protein n=1 Tax=Apiosordaria backusii TaxID=314023 RepID=A0AA40DIU0_9PEZI|nr:hypothetical protein B0T21DRAFT_388211 [Apiosordaria backusii]